MEQYIDEFGNLQFRQPSNNLPFRSMVNMQADNNNFLKEFNDPAADLNNVAVEIPALPPVFSIQNNVSNNDNSLTPFSRAKSGIMKGTRKGLDIGKKGFNIGKQGLLTALGFATGLPLGILGMLPERDPRQNALDDFYGDQYGLTSTGSVASGIMKGYNPVSGGLFGTDTNYGLGGAIDKRIARIQKTLKKKKSAALQQRVRDLQELKVREDKALADARALAQANKEIKSQGYRDYGQGAASQATQRSYEAPDGSYGGASTQDYGGGE